MVMGVPYSGRRSCADTVHANAAAATPSSSLPVFILVSPLWWSAKRNHTTAGLAEHSSGRVLGRRAPLPHPGRALEGMRELQHAEVVAVASHDLQAYGEPVAGEAGGHRDRRVAGRGDEVAGLHPLHVIRELHAVDLGDIRLIDGEG